MEADSSSKKSKFCPLIEVSHNKKKVVVHKTTAVWLLQDGERVSIDCLFRVRAKQPFSIGNLRSKVLSYLYSVYFSI